MKTKYIKKEIADLNNTGSPIVYYRMKRRETLGLGDFIKQCHRSNPIFAPSILQGVIMIVCEQLAEDLANGFNVKIDGIGTFHAKLGLNDYTPGRKMDSFEEGTRKLNAASLGVTGVGFRADKELVRAVNCKCKLERGGEDRLRKSKYTKEERIERAIQYLRRMGVMHVRDYARLNGLSHTTAYRELEHGLVGSATITSRGSKSAKVYFLKPQIEG